MNSKKKKEIEEPYYEIDENGKIKVLPLKWPKEFMPAKTDNEQTTASKRKIFSIERLVLTPLDFDESPKRLSKVPKIEKTVRKELFRIPPKGKRESYLPNRRFSSRNSLNSRLPARQSKQPAVNGSPLMNIDEADEMLDNVKSATNLGYPFKPPTKPVINFVKANKTAFSKTAIKKCTPVKTAVTKREVCDTPSGKESIESEAEFLKIEKALGAEPKLKTNEIHSPLSSVCNLLTNTKLSRSTTKSNILECNSRRIVDDIKQIVEKDRQEYETFVNQHQENISNIMKLLSRLENCQCNKENENRSTPKRRSGRIAAQSTLKENQAKMVSPGISKGIDLRKATLNKNLSKNINSKIESPRLKKAVDLYNTFRNDCSVLCTPKMDRTQIESSNNGSLSRRIQKQCLMLQDTPRQEF